MAKKTGLGRGLSALMAEMQPTEPAPEAAPAAAGVAMLPVAMVGPSPIQPRQQFDPVALKELADSIAARGVLQPILVRPVDPQGSGGPPYEIIAGERRWRASQMAGLHEIPVVVRQMDDAEGFEAALIENVQRADLNPLEEAEGYYRLTRDFGHTPESVATLTGKSRSHIANLIRLLDLPEVARTLLTMGVMSVGHAKVVLGAADPGQLARDIAERGLSVRQAEQEARRSHEAPKPRAAAKGRDVPPWQADMQAVLSMLEDALGMRVHIAMKGEGGTLAVKFSDLDQLDLLIARLQAERGGR